LSLRLVPPSPSTPRPWPLLRLGLRFLIQSLLAGLDVARRALDPRLPMSPSLLRQPTALTPGPRRALFGALTSQVPGTLAVGSGDRDALLYHCLDHPQDAARGLATDEALFLAGLGADLTAPRERRP
jgi:multicomponent Na+:H+ antiporter subunit E